MCAACTTNLKIANQQQRRYCFSLSGLPALADFLALGAGMDTTGLPASHMRVVVCSPTLTFLILLLAAAAASPT